ncbi:MAG: hypothetical protein RBS16_01440 [Candidatus Cloacimonadales bacterium]|jgi:hypothetical protein|nr:hypothetical protein [Candidatus Cloacimonadota bacterium]MDD2650456.1 hypothetical protein [Candidatus Cloacimonadota bacterium]MDD3501437.1 hypothetical protein [Candidatus Cloacimonadota bacterium]MDX9976675.1 hypothetical protein [Candidatus Cloacimonadales bacterium]
MSKELNPLSCINKIQKSKYTVLAFPMAIIVINLFCAYFLHYEFIKIVSVLAMLFYLYILWLYRVNDIDIDSDSSKLFSPINGKIIDIQEFENFRQITVLKSINQSPEVRSMSNEDIIGKSSESTSPSFYIKGLMARLFDVSMPHLQGQLVGIAAGKTLAYINIPNSYELCISVNFKVTVGKTIIGIAKENYNG